MQIIKKTLEPDLRQTFELYVMYLQFPQRTICSVIWSKSGGEQTPFHNFHGYYRPRGLRLLLPLPDVWICCAAHSISSHLWKERLEGSLSILSPLLHSRSAVS